MTEEGPKPAQAHPANGQGGHAPTKDIEGLVRQALSQHLMGSPYFPPTLARTLATDIAAVRTGNRADGAAGKADSANDCRGDDTGLTLSALWSRVMDSSTEMRAQLIERHGLPAALADELIKHGQEGALTTLMASGFPRKEVEALAEQLAKEEVLTPTLLLRSLCLGELMFFESAMAALSATSVDRVHALLYDDGPPGFLKLYELAHLPLGLFRAFRGSVEVILQLRRETARHWRVDFTDQIIARLVKEYEQVCPEDLEHVLSQLSRRLEEATPLAEPNSHASV